MQQLIEHVSAESMKILQRGIAPVILIVDPELRRPLSTKMEQFKIDIVVLSHAELDTNAKYEVLGTININF